MRLFRFFFWLAALAGVFVGILRLTCIRWVQVPTQSNDPLLVASTSPSVNAGDWLLLWRFTPPSFGSLVMCPDPQEAGRVIIGRLLGEEGDTISVAGTVVSVNDHALRTERGCTESTFKVRDPNTGALVLQHCDAEAAGGVVHMRGTMEGLSRIPLSAQRQVGDGKIFLVSDNRAYPFDSRHYGAVDRSSCKESIFFRLWSEQGFQDEKQRFTYIP